MKTSETLSTAFSALVSRFRLLPDVVYYDNACNLARSIILRCPWVLKETRICYDRFHNKSHTCSSAFDPDSYPAFENHKTSGAESMNSRWATSRTHIRFLNGENLIPFITANATFLNIRAMYRDIKKTKDVE